MKFEANLLLLAGKSPGVCPDLKKPGSANAFVPSTGSSIP